MFFFSPLFVIFCLVAPAIIRCSKSLDTNTINSWTSLSSAEKNILHHCLLAKDDSRYSTSFLSKHHLGEVSNFVVEEASFAYLLHLASDANAINVIQDLHSKGVSMDIIDASGKTPLHYAIASGSLQAADLLIQLGADTEQECFDGLKPSVLAISCGVEAIIQRSKDKFALKQIDCPPNPLHSKPVPSTSGAVNQSKDKEDFPPCRKETLAPLSLPKQQQQQLQQQQQPSLLDQRIKEMEREYNQRFQPEIDFTSTNSLSFSSSSSEEDEEEKKDDFCDITQPNVKVVTATPTTGATATAIATATATATATPITGTTAIATSTITITSTVTEKQQSPPSYVDFDFLLNTTDNPLPKAPSIDWSSSSTDDFFTDGHLLDLSLCQPPKAKGFFRPDCAAVQQPSSSVSSQLRVNPQQPACNDDDEEYVDVSLLFSRLNSLIDEKEKEKEKEKQQQQLRIASSQQSDENIVLHQRLLEQKHNAIIEQQYYQKQQNPISSEMLFTEIAKGKYSILEEYLKFPSASLDLVDSLTGNSLLHLAVYKNAFHVVRYLLGCGLDVNKVNHITSFTPLLMAAKLNYTDVAMLLIENGNANVFAENQYGYTALHFAVHFRNYKLCQRLLQLGANPCKETIGFTQISPYSMIREAFYDDDAIRIEDVVTRLFELIVEFVPASSLMKAAN